MNYAHFLTVHFLTEVKLHRPAAVGRTANKWLVTMSTFSANYALEKMPYDDQVNSLIGDHPSPGRLVRVFFHWLEFLVHHHLRIVHHHLEIVHHYKLNIMVANILKGLRHGN